MFSNTVLLTVSPLPEPLPLPLPAFSKFIILLLRAKTSVDSYVKSNLTFVICYGITFVILF